MAATVGTVGPLRDRRGLAAAAGVLAVFAASLSACGGDSVHVTRDITYGAHGGTPLTLDVYSPSGHKTGAGTADLLPAIVVIHGGAWTQGDKRDVSESARGFAEAKFVAVAINYSIPPPGQRFPAELDDSQAAVRWVQQHAQDLGIDPNRVGVEGSSAGGNLAMMIGVIGTGDASMPRVKAVASWSGVSDLSVLVSSDGKSHADHPPVGCGTSTTCIGVATPAVFTDYLGCTLARCPTRYRNASPISFVSPQSPPMYLAAFHDD
ncbi:MAG TPA: alpha/beta hydrolase, partial [Acidimicrobiia bacterium]|nr:alpha/beta hydrolase [Acidimicrobiia bacterium]